ncbi:MAG: cell division protein FtsX [Alphaproteobacteria bacterium]
MLGRQSALPLHEDATNRFLPWIVALMVFLAALALAGALVLDGAVARWRSSHGSTLTVQVPPGKGQDTEARLAAVVNLLEGIPGVVGVRPLTRDELAALLEPWLGRGNVVADLPLPRLVDVTLGPGAAPDLAAIENRLQKAAPGSSIDDHGIWLERLADAARSLQAVALAVVLAIGVAAVGTVVFTTRASLAVHHDSIEILHLMGAQDAFVAGAFARRALWLGLRGGLLGLALAAIVMAILYHVAGNIAAPLLPRLTLGPYGLGGLAALPLASAVIAMLTARITVLGALERMP